jgi:hypothetical protein
MVVLRIVSRGNRARYGSGTNRVTDGAMLDSIALPPYIADASDLATAHELISDFGPRAADEAVARAADARDRENVGQFCRWRQVARLVTLLARPGVWGTIH